MFFDAPRARRRATVIAGARGKHRAFRKKKKRPGALAVRERPRSWASPSQRPEARRGGTLVAVRVVRGGTRHSPAAPLLEIASRASIHQRNAAPFALHLSRRLRNEKYDQMRLGDALQNYSGRQLRLFARKPRDVKASLGGRCDRASRARAPLAHDRVAFRSSRAPRVRVSRSEIVRICCLLH